MAVIIHFLRKREADEYPTFVKVVDGKVYECVDVDALTPRQREKFFERAKQPL